MQTGWLRTTVYLLTVLGARDQDPGVVQAMPAPEAPGAPFLPLPAPGSRWLPWLVAASLQAWPPSSHGLSPLASVSSHLSLLETPAVQVGPTLMTLGDGRIIS